MLGFGGSRIDHGFDFQDVVRREAALSRVLTYGLFIRRDIDAVDLVGSDIALYPLDLGPQVAKHTAGSLRDRLKLMRGESPRAGQIALDYEFRHVLISALSF